MSSSTPTVSLQAAAAPAAGNLYRAVWRWHFYAGLLVLPFLIWLAVTGGLYVFKAEIDGYFHRDLKFVAATDGAPRAHSELVAAALAAHPGSLRKYRAAAATDDSAEISVLTSQGEALSVFVDPYRAQVLGALADRSSVAWTIRKLHSLKYFGALARGAIEIAAGWAILLVLTGIYLWWPRGKGRGGVLVVRGQPRQRLFWRDLHAVTGIFVGAALVFLALTGMPWSVVWGAKVNEWANGHNFGYPAGVRVAVPMSQQRLNDVAPTSWSVEQARLPESAHAAHDAHQEHAGHDEHNAAAAAPVATSAQALSLDQAMAIFSRLGIAPGFSVNPPKGPAGVYSASVYPNVLAQQRVIHLDQYSGQPLIDMAYADYGPFGRWLEWGINVHMGQEFGVPNQALLVLVCLAIVLLCVSAATMWWKRRPAGGLGVPPLPAERRVLRGVVALLALGGLLFPLVGASLLVMLVLDQWLSRGASTFQPMRR
ncbi:PepSY-associated TM helix domain-containing protein [Variovorax sp. HJSM1_2]|uniref:PepSY-associated TM helix domain-containing protein n=1 Tax=Variovorax sp. HJSM1_2 TaxID=3366263 RepID=UPI003BE6CACA